MANRTTARAVALEALAGVFRRDGRAWERRDRPTAPRGGGPITPVVGMASPHVGEVEIELAPEQRS